MKNFFTNNSVLLFFIVSAATILRLINCFDIPFTYDEFSALFRTNFNTFGELIERGVKIDGHPAGVQVFLFYWVKFVGWSEIAVKFPFIIAGILSVILIYRIGKEWFNAFVGLICASFVATIEYTVMYSQIARPYISGLFFSLLMVYFWNKILFHPDKNKFRNISGYILSSALCCYNHHFSLLFAAIVGATGLFFISKKQLLTYILCAVFIVIFYLPHLQIFFYQLSMGGVEGWLGKPHNDFLIEYIKYVFHFSATVYCIVALLILGGLVRNTEKKFFKNKFFTISLLWFFLPFLIGFFYSKYINAILQYSVLIFSFPFFLFAVFGHIQDRRDFIKPLSIFLICLLNIFSLVFSRQYYSLFYQSPFSEIIIETDKTLKNKGNNNCVAIIDSDEEITQYYLEKHKININFLWLNTFKNNYVNFIEFFKKQDKPYLALGCRSGSDPVIPNIIFDYYPHIEKKINYAGGNYYLFSKANAKNDTEIIFSMNNDFEKRYDKWSGGDEKNYVDTFAFSGKYSYCFSQQNEWGPTYTIPLNDIINNENNFIDVSVKFHWKDSIKNALLVASLESADSLFYWGSGSFQATDDKTAQWQTAYHTIKLPDIYLNYKNIKLKVYIWNDEKSNFYIDDVCMRVRTGNPVVYGLFEKIY